MLLSNSNVVGMSMASTVYEHSFHLSFPHWFYF